MTSPDQTQDAAVPPSDTDSTPPPESESAERETQRRGIPGWLEFPLLILAALLIAVVIKTFLFQAFYIPSASMEDTLQVLDRVLVSKISYAIGDIERGDVIVFDDPRPGFEQPDEDALQRATRNLRESIGLSTPQSEFIKRVIGIPGDVVEGRDGGVWVNGVALVEPYVKEPDKPIGEFGPVLVPEGSLFVMGDNRHSSQDSRIFGPIPIDDVVGKAVVIIWPLGRLGGV